MRGAMCVIFCQGYAFNGAYDKTNMQICHLFLATQWLALYVF